MTKRKVDAAVTAITPQEAADELRYRAGRLRLEMNLPHAPDHADGKGFPITLLLSLALIDAANAEWEARLRHWPELRERAIKLCREDNHRLGDLGEKLLTNGVPGIAAVIAHVNARQLNGAEGGDVLALQANMHDPKPLWAQYLLEASLQIETEA